MHSWSHYLQMNKKTGTSGELFQKWLANLNDSMSATATHPGGHQITHNIQRTTAITGLSQGSVFVMQQMRTGKKKGIDWSIKSHFW